MSLSFVASAVQTGTADGGFEETPIESKTVDAVNRQNSHQPLFEQLRQKQEEEELKQEEFQREMMRGTRALDEEDVAHLDSLQKQRYEREQQIQQRTQDELAAFRAARAEQQQILIPDDEQVEIEEGYEKDNLINKEANRLTKVIVKKPVAPALKPKIIVKKRKQLPVDSSVGGTAGCDGTKSIKKAKPDEDAKTKEKSEEKGLGGLLCGYGSSDEDSD